MWKSSTFDGSRNKDRYHPVAENVCQFTSSEHLDAVNVLTGISTPVGEWDSEILTSGLITWSGLGKGQDRKERVRP